MVWTSAFGFVIVGLCFSYFNSLTKILHKQYKHEDKYVIGNHDIFNSVVSVIIPLAAILGSILANPLASKGRRFAMIVIATAGIIGSCITMIFDMTALLAGRFILGLCVGAYTTVSPLYMSEFAPRSISGSLGAITQFGAVSGIFIGNASGLLIPLENDSDALTSRTWRIVFILPAIICFIQLVLFIFVFRYDTPKFYKIKKDQINYLKMMRCIYVYEDEEPNEEVQETERRFSQPDEENSQKENDSENQVNAEMGPINNENENEVMENGTMQELQISKSKPDEDRKDNDEVEAKTMSKTPAHYKKAFTLGLLLSLFHQLTGINGVIFFSNEMFTDGEEGNDAERTARYGSLGLGAFSLLGSTLSIFALKYFGRVTNLNINQAVMGT